ncbi:hypothetical protein [Candidatus Poriferisocius sp.]|uniref:hypothetical protein n=1 Tax=Candidatus Poriferisocius sp. TaxID=3101276 RepID=UPI003B012EE2
MRLLQRLLPAILILTPAIAPAACSSSDSTRVVVGSESPSPDPVQTPTPEIATPEGVASTPEPVAIPTVTPTEAPDAAGLVWTEVDLADALGADETSTIQLQSVGDGRILAMSFVDRGMDSILVTENGREWTPISVPAGFLTWSVDITGNRWLIQGWDSTHEAPSTQIRFSDDHGANWTEIVVDLASLDGTAWIADAIVAGQLMVVAAIHEPGVPLMEGGGEGDVDFEPSVARVQVLLSDGGPAEPVADFPGWFASGHGASDGFRLIVSDSGQNYLLYSSDGREWTSTPVDVEVTDSAHEMIWTADEGYTEYRIERFEGVYGSGQVLTLPEGIGWVPGLAVGPAGVAMVGGPPWPGDESDRDFTMPDIVIEKDGYELRYNQPEGGISLWDLDQDEAVIVFDAETLQREEPPDVVQEVESDDGSILVVFYDPTTGAELVAFSGERLEAAVIEASIVEEDSAAYLEYDPHNYMVGWSREGLAWQWQTLQEAFGLPERSEDANSFTEVQVAVGQDFVLAQVQNFEFPEADIDEDFNVGVDDGQSGSVPAPLTAPEILASPPRWYIARVG